MRVDFVDISASLTPTDALSESSRPIDRKVGRGSERNHLATGEVDKLSSNSDGRCAEAYRATKMDLLHYGIPARREDGIFAVSSL